MTAPTSLPSTLGTRLPDRPPRALAATCDVCPHPAAAHDRIGQRFCDATLAGAVTRGCICRA